MSTTYQQTNKTFKNKQKSILLTLEKNLISLVLVLKLVLLLKVVEGFKSFILIVALSIYWINFSSKEYANLSSIATPVVVCSVSLCGALLGLCSL